jgi:hypothetical protein
VVWRRQLFQLEMAPPISANFGDLGAGHILLDYAGTWGSSGRATEILAPEKQSPDGVRFPAMLIALLDVDERYRGRGLGQHMVKNGEARRGVAETRLATSLRTRGPTARATRARTASARYGMIRRRWSPRRS